MNDPRRASSRWLAILALFALPGCAQAETAKPPLGLMGTIPVYWGEAGELQELIEGTATPHWARATLERDYRLQPIEYLDSETLDAIDYLLLAQPRALSGEENVAVDAWVRNGGRVLLFADPMMTGHSRFAIGDRRRPQDVTLLSPILRHWGLELEFVEDQAVGPRVVRAGALELPVNLPGRFTLREGADCTLSADALLARCAIGEGAATIVADAALLDLHDTSPLAEPALEGLRALAFKPSGDVRGR